MKVLASVTDSLFFGRNGIVFNRTATVGLGNPTNTTSSSRLGCQVVVTEDLRGLKATLPPATRNMAVDGFVPQPH